MSDNVRVLVIDDSAYNRQSISDMLAEVPGVEVVGRAGDGNEGLRQVLELQPDVITLDLEMPRMDGYTFLRILMSKRPTPVVVVSSHSARKDVFRALELGAIDFIAKPAKAVSPELRTISHDLVEKIQRIGQLRSLRLQAPPGFEVTPPPKRRAATVQQWGPMLATQVAGVVCIAASTGGPPALRKLVEGLPGNLPLSIVISQHMPAGFTQAFAKRLDSCSRMYFKEAESGDRLRPAMGFVAPGTGSVVFAAGEGEPVLRLEAPGPNTRIVPCADRMLETAAAAFGSRCLAIVLTGMGSDGSVGVRAVRDAGGATIAESADSAVIHGMPSAAIQTGAVQEVLPLEQMAGAIAAFAQKLSH